MDFNYYLQKCSDDDVIQLSGAIYKMGHLKIGMEYALKDQNKVPYSLHHALQEKGVKLEQINNTQKLLYDGLDAEVLRLGAKGWQKGKIKIKVTVEFCPDEPEISEPESPLDDLRQLLKHDN